MRRCWEYERRAGAQEEDIRENTVCSQVETAMNWFKKLMAGSITLLKYMAARRGDSERERIK